MITITQDEFIEVATDVAAKVTYEVDDVKLGLLLSMYAAAISNELFKKEDK